MAVQDETQMVRIPKELVSQLTTLDVFPVGVKSIQSKVEYAIAEHVALMIKDK